MSENPDRIRILGEGTRGEKRSRTKPRGPTRESSKRVEVTPEQGPESYGRLFEWVNDAIFLRPLPADGSAPRFLEVNGVACQRLGYSREEFLQMVPSDIDPCAELSDIQQRIKDLPAGESVLFETVHIAKGGREIPVEINSRVVEWEGKRMVLSVARDLRERKAAEVVLRESEQRFRQMLENVNLCALMLDPDGKVLFINPYLLHLTGWTTEEVVGGDWFDRFVPTEQRRILRELFESLKAGASISRFESEVLTRDGGRRLIAWNNSSLGDAGGRLVGITSLGEDITERRRADEALRQSEENFRNLFTNAPIGIYQSDRQRLVNANPALARMFGYTDPAEMVASQQSLSEVYVNPGQREALIEAALASPGYVRQEVEFYRKDGTVLPAALSMRAVRGEHRDIKLLEGFIWDLRDRKKAERELRESEGRFRQLADNIGHVFWIRDVQTQQILYISPAFDRIWGQPRENIGGMLSRLLETIHPDDRSHILEMRSRTLQGEPNDTEYRILRPDGSMRWIRDRAFGVRNERGEIYRLAGIAEDITEHRSLEEQFQQAQKMEAVGQLAGGVAHDFNNILAATLLHLGLLQHNTPLPAGVKEMLTEIEGEITRAANLTRQLLLFSRRQVARFEPVDLTSLVGELLKMLRRLLGEHIKMELESRSEFAWVKADAGMLEQVLMNLCVNARDAMPRGGRLTLITETTERTTESPKTHVDARPGRFVCLSVSDTGCGIPPEVLERVFEPFFTTKEVGKGTGLGLATVYGIVKQHEGWIEVNSQLNVGTTFHVFLPALPKPARPSSRARQAEEIPPGSETILLVEDESSVRASAALCLRKLGYAVLEATHGAQALQVWQQHQTQIDLLLTDQVMPDAMTGLELAGRLRLDRPDLPVILSSGYSDELGPDQAAALQGVTFLAKPYRAAPLARLVRRCLDESRRS